MGLCLGKTTSSSSLPPWLDLPPELTGLILSWLSCRTDRRSFGAVCQHWRFTAQDHHRLLRTAMPWINLGGGFYHSLATGADINGVAWRPFATPEGCHAGASFGRWLMYEEKCSHRCFLHDPFSHATPRIRLPFIEVTCGADAVAVADTDPLTTWHSPSRDILFCSSRRLFAIFLHFNGACQIICLGLGASQILDPCFGLIPTQPSSVSWSNPAGQLNHGPDTVYKSIAFHHGKIFAVNSTENLFSHDILHGKGHFEHVIKEGPAAGAANYHNHHLITSADMKSLLMVRWSIHPQTHTGRLEVGHRKMELQVFEADLEKGEWSPELKNLGHQVVFVGRTGSRALVADQQFQGNCVFLLGYEWASSRCKAAGIRWIPDRNECHDNTPNYCVYDMISGKASLVYLSPGPSGVKYPKSTWLFPSQ